MYARWQSAPDGCTFLWKIENINRCWLKQGERLDSPPFIAGALEETKWTLRLYPMGQEDEDCVGFFLHRDVDCSGPTDIEVSFQFSFLGKSGSFLKAKYIPNRSFPRNRSWGFGDYEERENVFVAKKGVFPLEYTLMVKCTIWDTEEKPVNTKQLYARTVFKENRRFFMWRIGKFSDLKLDLTKKFKDGLIDFDFTLEKDKGFEKTLNISINSLDESIKYFSVKSSIVDSEGKKENCGFHEYFKDDLKIGELHALPFRKWLIKNSSRYHSIDVLFLDCEYVIPIKTACYESLGFGLYSPELMNEAVVRKNEDYVEKEKSISPDVLNDLKFMYDDAIFSDTELRTSTKTFPTHKAILSARSSVFKCMFSNDMKEKNSGHVDITDFGEDTVQRMLLYMYTDSLEDLQLESACKLYAIADKYEILSLKSRCSSFLKENLCPENACEILFLSDQHQDVRLKCFVQDYMLMHETEVFGSQEWRDFMDSNTKLAADLMYRKVYPV